ncbi:kinase-like domain-containing protein [Leptodontidium sp. 2 PMI_412]|nr:kinase-like domain-containing protein [Leptodontidium sp. 2 PMI_412]
MLGNVEEINILKQLNHQHIAQMCGVYVLGADLYSLSYPVAEMDLDDYMRQGKHCDPTWVQSLIGGLGCLSRALAYAHSAGIKHKDIHAGNILVIGGMMILCDWGLSSLSTGSSGSSNAYYDPRAEDVRRLGFVFEYMILSAQTDPNKINTARLPTSRLKLKDILSRMADGRKRLEYADFGDLIKIMTESDMRKRPTARQVADYLRLGEFAWAWRCGMPDGEGAVVCTTCGGCCV